MSAVNDGRPDFAVNPFNGPMPNFDEAQRRLCQNAPGPTCLRPSANTIAPPPEFAHAPYSYQTSFGMQRQFGEVMALEVDYAYTGGRHERFGQGHNPVMNFNLTYDAATGINYPFTNIARRADPNWGVVQMEIMERRSNYHGVVTGFTKRMRNRWQASGTYTLSWLYTTIRCRSAGCSRSRLRSRRTSAASTAWPPPISAIAPCSTASGTSVAAFR